MQEKGPRYKVEGEVGRGAFGVVYRARDNLLRRTVALKVMSLPEGLSPEESEHLVERFHREARAAAGLSHPNIVIIHDISRAGGRHFISMEFLEGQPLSEVIGGSPMPLERAGRIADEVLAALEYAHSRNIVHRDIKPDNIFILPGDSVKLVDFGLARVQATSTITRTGTVMGSPGYIAPEVVEGRQADARTDIFSFGVVLYEMLTGARPFGPMTPFESFIHVIYRIMSEDPAPPSSLNDEVPAALDAVVARCLAKDPGMRFGDVGELRAALASALGDGTQAPGVERAAARAPAGPSPTTDFGTSGTLVQEGAPAAGPAPVTESVVEGWEKESPGGRDSAGGRRRWWLAGAAAALLLLGAAAVLLVVFLGGGSSQADVPNLINLTSKKAREALADAGLEVGEVTEGFSYDIWKGKVMRQMPGAGTSVKKDSSVDFVVSLGQDVVQVPDVLNKPFPEAKQVLENFGFEVRKDDAFKEGLAVGTVFEQRPAPGTLKDRGFEVILVVNSGVPKDAVPKKEGDKTLPVPAGSAP